MSSEEKTYSVVGTVTIGTDEYRDLIESNKENEKLYDEYRAKYWSERSENDSNKKAAEALKQRVDEFNDFMNSVDGVRDKFKLWKLDQQEEV